MSTITIQSFVIPNCQFNGNSAVLRIYALKDFITSAGQPVVTGAIGSRNIYKSVSCTKAGANLTVPSFTIDSTSDGFPITGKYAAVFYSQSNTLLFYLSPGFVVPTSLGSSITWNALIAYNSGNVLVNAPSSYLDRDALGLLLQHYQSLSTYLTQIANLTPQVGDVLRFVSGSPSQWSSEALDVPSSEVFNDISASLRAKLTLWISPHATRLMSQSSITNDFTGYSEEDGDTIGRITDLSPLALTAQINSSSARPTLGSGFGRKSLMKWTTSNVLTVVNSKKAFNHFHQLGKGTIIIGLSTADVDGSALLANGTSALILDSNSGTTANSGIYLERTTANKLNLAITKSVAMNSVVDYTTTATLTTANGFVWVVIKLNGPGTNTGSIQIGNNAVETFNISAGGSVDATADLNLNSGAGFGLNKFAGLVSGYVFASEVLSDSEILEIKNFNPQRTNAYQAKPLVTAETLLPNQVTQLERWYRFGAVENLFQNTAKTSPASFDSNPVRTVQSVANPIVNRDGVSASDGVRPLYKIKSEIGQGATEWDGVDDNFDIPDWFLYSDGTMFCVYRNNDNTLGSHLMSGGVASGVYWVVTGANYSGNVAANNGNPYSVLHVSGGLTTSPISVSPNEVNVIAIRRTGDAWKTWTFSNSLGLITVEDPSGLNGRFAGFCIGIASNLGWEMNGYQTDFAIFNASMSDETVEKILLGLGALVGIS